MKMISRSLIVAASAMLTLLGGLAPTLAQTPEVTTVAAPTSPLSFPREISGEAGTVVIHTPQIDTWKDFTSLEARAAISVTPAGEDEPVYGVVEFTADTDPNLELRVVAVENMKISATSFPVADDARREQLVEILRSTFQPKTQYVPLDVILSYIAPQAKLPEETGLSFEPPPIFYSSTPAVLVITDGEPLLAPVPDTKLQYAVNTNWDLFRYKDREWYLRHESRWLKNKQLSGDWKFDSTLPKDFKKLPDDDNWKEVREHVPGSVIAAPPTVFVSEQPAELIVTDGVP